MSVDHFVAILTFRLSSPLVAIVIIIVMQLR